MSLHENTMIKSTFLYEEYVTRKERSLRLEETNKKKIIFQEEERFLKQGTATTYK